jgi:pyruvate, orthophosphate dikinase
MNELALLQLARVKGLLTPEAAAASLGAAPQEVAEQFERFRERGWLDPTPRGWRLTPAGRKTTAEQLEQERTHLDAATMKALYDEFCGVNGELKAVMTAWQLRGDGTPNDHTDKTYDQGVIARLKQLHANADPIVQRLEQAAPRLTHYRLRLGSALAKVGNGDTTYVARPITDSYHTVWFELHEDLIAMNGLTRAAEAKAGRAQ